MPCVIKDAIGTYARHCIHSCVREKDHQACAKDHWYVRTPWSTTVRVQLTLVWRRVLLGRTRRLTGNWAEICRRPAPCVCCQPAKSDLILSPSSCACVDLHQLTATGACCLLFTSSLFVSDLLLRYRSACWHAVLQLLLHPYLPSNATAGCTSRKGKNIITNS